VIGIFPNEDAIVRLVGAILLADSDGLRTGFRRKPDSNPMIADSR